MIKINGVQYMTDFEAKKGIIEVGKRMFMKGFVASNDGNISVRTGPNTFWVTPTGVSKGFMTPDMMVKMDLSGKVLFGKTKPSSEVKMHLRVYNENPNAMAVTHAHPPVATSFAIAGISLDQAILPEAVVNLGTVPIAPYATPGSQEVPDSIAPYCKTHNGVLLANHGALTWGKELFEAYYRLESLEYYATVLMYTGNIIGKANVLSCNQVSELMQIRQNLGISSGGTPQCSIGIAGSGMAQNSGNNTAQNAGSNAGYNAGNNAGACQCQSENRKDTLPGKTEDKDEAIRLIVERVTQAVLQNYRK